MHKESSHLYALRKPLSNFQILEKASEIVALQFKEKEAFCNAETTKQYFTFKLSQYEREVFAVLLLDNQNQLIEYQELFFGTVDSATVHPREVVKAVLAVNGSAVILAHNHPSGSAEPSQADINITKRLSEALALIDVRVLDHIVVGRVPVSFAERGLI